MVSLDEYIDDFPEEPSKSARKREHHEIKALGETLTRLSDRQWRTLGLDETLRTTLAEARKLKHGALQRQLRHIANLLEAHDLPQIRAGLKAMLEPSQESVRRLHEIERWRDALLAGDDGVLAEITARCPGVDVVHVRQLARAARNAQAGDGGPQSARKLFTYLRQARERPVSDATTAQ